MRARTMIAIALFHVSTMTSLWAVESLPRAQNSKSEVDSFGHFGYYSGAILLAIFVLMQAALLLTPKLRRTAAGKKTEHVLRKTGLETVVKYLYWRATPGMLRRWMGKSNASTFKDVLNYTRHHETRLRDIELAEVGAELVEQDPAGYELWKTSGGPWWVPAGQSAALFDLLAEQKRGIYTDGQSSVRAGDVVLDCGANIGFFVRQALNSEAKLVVASEPAQDSMECLRRNLAHEIATGKVQLCPKGVWHSDETLVLAGSGVAARIIAQPPNDRERVRTVQLTTIDRLCEEFGLDSIDFIKMDIEGAEVPALNGAQLTLSKCHPRLALAGYHKQDDSETIPASVLSAWSGYRLKFGTSYHPGLVRPETLFFY